MTSHLLPGQMPLVFGETVHLSRFLLGLALSFLTV